MSYDEQRRHDYSDAGGSDYEGRLKDSFFKYVKRRKDYDQNEVPWEDQKEGVKPVMVQMSAYLRKVLTTSVKAFTTISITNRTEYEFRNILH